MIQGRIYFPSGQSVSGKTIKISLESVSAFGSMSTVADQDGTFRFHKSCERRHIRSWWMRGRNMKRRVSR